MIQELADKRHACRHVRIIGIIGAEHSRIENGLNRIGQEIFRVDRTIFLSSLLAWVLMSSEYAAKGGRPENMRLNDSSCPGGEVGRITWTVSFPAAHDEWTPPRRLHASTVTRLPQVAQEYRGDMGSSFRSPRLDVEWHAVGIRKSNTRAASKRRALCTLTGEMTGVCNRPCLGVPAPVASRSCPECVHL